MLVLVHIDEVAGHGAGFRHLAEALPDGSAGPTPTRTELEHGAPLSEAARDLLGGAAADVAIAEVRHAFDESRDSRVCRQNARVRYRDAPRSAFPLAWP